MPVETLSGQPSEFTAGETVRFTFGDSAFPSSDWTASLTLRNGTSILTSPLSASGDGRNFDAVFTATETEALTPGVYQVSAAFTATAGGDKAKRNYAQIRVRPDLTNVTVGPARTAYDTARAALTAKLSGDASFNFNGQSATSYPLRDLQEMVDRLYIEALDEDRRLGIGNAGGVQRIQMYA